MKRFILFIILLFMVLFSFAQQKFKIRLCDEMNSKEVNSVIQLYLLSRSDTLFIPKVEANTYLNPIDFYKIKSSFDKTDTSTYTILIENSKFIYKMNIRGMDLYCEELQICIEPYKRKNIVKASYLNCSSIWTSMFSECKKKR